MNDIIIFKSFELGQKAFLTGKKRMPVENKEILDFAKSQSCSERINMFSAFIRGWDTEKTKFWSHVC